MDEKRSIQDEILREEARLAEIDDELPGPEGPDRGATEPPVAVQLMQVPPEGQAVHGAAILASGPFKSLLGLGLTGAAEHAYRARRPEYREGTSWRKAARCTA